MVESRGFMPLTPKDTYDQQRNVAVIIFPEEKGDIPVLYCMLISVALPFIKKTPV